MLRNLQDHQKKNSCSPWNFSIAEQVEEDNLFLSLLAYDSCINSQLKIFSEKNPNFSKA